MSPGPANSRFKQPEDCLFCHVLSRSVAELDWHDRPLLHLPGIGGVIAGLGAFAPGYVLVFPETHVTSSLSILGQLSRLFENLLEEVTAVVKANFGEVTVFEHGACSRDDVRRSACLDHAHIHVMPGSYSIQDRVIHDLVPCDINDIGADLHSRGYLYLREPGRAGVFYGDPGESQFFRRRIASQLGDEDSWDYLLFPHVENVRRTIASLSGAFGTDLGATGQGWSDEATA